MFFKPIQLVQSVVFSLVTDLSANLLPVFPFWRTSSRWHARSTGLARDANECRYAFILADSPHCTLILLSLDCRKILRLLRSVCFQFPPAIEWSIVFHELQMNVLCTVDDNVTIDCFLLHHEMAAPAMITTNPVRDLRTSLSDPQSASQKACSFVPLLSYRNFRSIVPRK